jgi:hypothetical protein
LDTTGIVKDAVSGASPATGDPAASAPVAAPPDVGSVPTPSPAGPPSASTDATPSAAAASPAAQPPQSKGGVTTTAQPATPAAATPQPQIVPIRVVHQGMRGMMDRVLDAVAGTKGREVAEDADGNKYISHPDLSRGQQWARVAQGALGIVAGATGGALRGLGKDPLYTGKEGAEAQQKKEANQDEEVKQDRLDKFNTVMQKQKILQNQFALTRLQMDSNDATVGYEKARVAEEVGLKSILLGGGPVKGVFDVPSLQKEHPEFIPDWINKKNIQVIPHTDETTGKHDGVSFYLRREGAGENIVPPGTAFHAAVLGDDGKYTLQTAHSAGPSTQNELDGRNDAAMQKMGSQQKAEADEIDKNAQAKLRTAQTGEANAKASEAPANIAKARAEGRRADAEAVKARGEDENDDAMTDMIGRGQINAGRLSYLMARKPEILDKVAKKYPDFDSSKVEGYAATTKDFTEGNTSRLLVAGANALQHLKALRDLNTSWSHIPGSPDYNAYQNQADTLAGELAKFYGDATIPAIAAIKGTLVYTTPGARQKAIATQVKSMGVALEDLQQKWDNAAPSKAYEAPMPGISEKAKDARAALDPEYAKQRVAEVQNAPAPQPAASQQATPQTHAWSASAWQTSHPGQNVQAATAAAKQAGYEVRP